MTVDLLMFVMMIFWYFDVWKLKCWKPAIPKVLKNEMLLEMNIFVMFILTKNWYAVFQIEETKLVCAISRNSSWGWRTCVSIWGVPNLPFGRTSFSVCSMWFWTNLLFGINRTVYPCVGKNRKIENRFKSIRNQSNIFGHGVVMWPIMGPLLPPGNSPNI